MENRDLLGIFTKSGNFKALINDKDVPFQKIALLAPDGNFASYCGMWYEPGTDYCLVEPVATDRAY